MSADGLSLQHYIVYNHCGELIKFTTAEMVLRIRNLLPYYTYAIIFSTGPPAPLHGVPVADIKNPLGPKDTGGQTNVIITQKSRLHNRRLFWLCNYFSLPSTASLRDLIAAWRKAGIGAPKAPAFSTILPSSVTMYHTSTTGPRNTE